MGARRNGTTKRPREPPNALTFRKPWEFRGTLCIQRDRARCNLPSASALERRQRFKEGRKKSPHTKPDRASAAIMGEALLSHRFTNSPLLRRLDVHDIRAGVAKRVQIIGPRLHHLAPLG